jgi:nucleotide-binding universal stress UspA family protein
MYKNILAPVDLAHPDVAVRTVATALKVAGSDDCKLTLLNVVPELPGFVAAELPAGIAEKTEAAAESSLKKIAKDAGVEGRSKLMVKHGRPHNQILQVAGEIGADLIVIASHQPGIEDYLLGSVAGKVVRHAKCSVLVER